MTNVIKYRGNEGANVPNLNRGPSPFIWGDCPWLAMQDDPNIGSTFWDDFNNFGGVVSANVGTYGGYKSYESNSTSLKQLAGQGGEVEATTTATDNDVVAFEAGYGNAGMWKLTAGTGPKLWFEARVRLNQIVTQDFFVGLAEVGLASSAGIISTGDALNDKSCIGFRILAAASTLVKSCLQLNGGGGERATGQQTVYTVVSPAAFVKLGFKYDINGLGGHKLSWFLNGVEQDFITDDTIAQFPTAINLTPLFFLRNSTTAVSTVDIDWWRIAQLSP